MNEGPNIETWPKRLGKKRVRVWCTIPGEAVPAARPRFWVARDGSKRTYMAGEVKEAKQKVATYIKLAHNELVPNGDTEFGVRVFFYCSDHRRKDLDNMVKMVLDACNGVVWRDDTQVIELNSIKVRGSDNPRTEIMVYDLGTKSHCFQICAFCHKEFKSYQSWMKEGPRGRKYCSRDCQTNSSRIETGYRKCFGCGKDIYLPPFRASRAKSKYFFCSAECYRKFSFDRGTCRNCQKEFELPRGPFARPGRLYCSKECSAAYRIKRKKETGYGTGICVDCGGTTSKKSYSRCLGCQVKNGRFIASKVWENQLRVLPPESQRQPL